MDNHIMSENMPRYNTPAYQLAVSEATGAHISGAGISCHMYYRCFPNASSLEVWIFVFLKYTNCSSASQRLYLPYNIKTSIIKEPVRDNISFYILQSLCLLPYDLRTNIIRSQCMVTFLSIYSNDFSCLSFGVSAI